jgi:hypothetical protein
MSNYETPEDYKARMDAEMDEMQAYWPTVWRHKHRWTIVDEGDGTFSVHEHTSDSICPPITKPNKRDAAARLLQCMGLGPVAPQDYPEEICVGEITNKPADVFQLSESKGGSE